MNNKIESAQNTPGKLTKTAKSINWLTGMLKDKDAISFISPAPITPKRFMKKPTIIIERGIFILISCTTNERRSERSKIVKTTLFLIFLSKMSV
ncbi:hypothetical protein TUM17567_06960 [Citrobacter amalonaticus]|nr:hypothetical protein TUM17567_06960 [Citrobacter amalonaticus]